MILMELALVLAVVAVAALPWWRHSAEWGYVPGASAGALLTVVLLIAATDTESFGRATAHRGLAKPGIVTATASTATTPTDR